MLQERFDSQALTLKLAKEQSGDLQVWCEVSIPGSPANRTAGAPLDVGECSCCEFFASDFRRSEKLTIFIQAKLESVTGKLNVEIAVLREQKAGLQATVTRVTEEAAAQQAGFIGASVDYENKLSKQEETHARLVQAETQRTVAAGRDAADAKRLADDLVQQLESGRAELEDAKKKAREVASRESLGMEGEVVVLRARLEELEGENSTLQNRARNLNKRYKDGDLVCFLAMAWLRR